MRILSRVNNSVLWLFGENQDTIANLKREATARNVNPQRLVFAKPIPLADHLARQAHADLFLDTLPCNAHTTASDALWAGLPLLTCVGGTFSGKVAASLLNAIQLPELITTTLEDYERTAIDLAREPAKLSAIKGKLGKNRFTTPLFDTKLFTRHLEMAYSAMYERYCAGLAPDHIRISG
jgi:predicted O-linked N-acetylglucosamine transferase (SPINDLY family)